MEVFNLFAEQGWDGQNDRAGYRHRVTAIGARLGAALLGGSLYELPPGERTWPYHYEVGCEEWLIAVSGQPTLRGPDGERELAPGDVAVFPRGRRAPTWSSPPAGARSSGWWCGTPAARAARSMARRTPWAEKPGEDRGGEVAVLAWAGLLSGAASSGSRGTNAGPRCGPWSGRGRRLGAGRGGRGPIGALRRRRRAARVPSIGSRWS